MSATLIEIGISMADPGEMDRVERQVRRRLTGRVRGFRVQVQDNGLILHGRALSYHVKQLAQHAVMQETELRILANRIEVP